MALSSAWFFFVLQVASMMSLCVACLLEDLLGLTASTNVSIHAVGSIGNTGLNGPVRRVLICRLGWHRPHSQRHPLHQLPRLLRVLHLAAFASHRLATRVDMGR